MSATPEPKVAVVIAGVVRDLEFSLSSYEASFLRGLHASGRLAQTIYVLGTRKFIGLNPRNKEWGKVPRIPRLPSSNLITLTTAELDFRTDEVFQDALKNGDPWPESRGRSLRNHLGMLYLQELSLKLIEKEVGTVFYLRPDLFAEEKVPLQEFSVKPSQLRVPAWHNFFGLNDRVGIMGRSAADVYLGRFRSIKEFLAEGRPLHAETFLEWCARDLQVSRDLNAKFARTRLQGRNSRTLAEDWDHIPELSLSEILDAKSHGFRKQSIVRRALAHVLKPRS